VSDDPQLFPDSGYLRKLSDEARECGLDCLDRGWLLAPICLILLAVSGSYAATTAGQTTVPIEVLGADGTTVNAALTLEVGQSQSVKALWLQIHGVRYANQASVQVNANDWIPLSNSSVTIAEPGRSFGGIGGGFSTLVMTLPLGKGMLADGENTIRFRFNQTDGIVSGYRVLALNLLTNDGKKLLPPSTFVEDRPETWAPPLPDEASIRTGQNLWQTAALQESSLANSRKIQAHCADCHASDGRDLKYFNFSNASIVARSRFHGLSTQQGEQIASYIRSLRVPNPGRPWNPPYQPGPGSNRQPISDWAAGAGLAWVLDRDADAISHLVSQDRAASARIPTHNPELRDIAQQISPNIFRPDGDLDPREIPIALQLPDWSQWLPRIHPKDAWGADFTKSEFAATYDGKTSAGPSLRALFAGGNSADLRSAVTAFPRWSRARSVFFRRVLKSKPEWSPELTNKVYSIQLWQLVKTWEITQEFGLESRGHELFGVSGDSRTWFNTIPAETAPSAIHIPSGPSGVGGSALANEYFNAAWYELQILLFNGNHQHRDRGPVDWVYVIGGFLDLHAQTHQPEPGRLLVAVTKALQSTDPHLGPDNLRQGWRPDANVDPRILVSPPWQPVFEPLPSAVRQALTTSLLGAWMDKNLQYSIATYLPIGLRGNAYAPPASYGGISGGRVWEAARQFRDAGVPGELVQRLEQWGILFADRAARIQY